MNWQDRRFEQIPVKYPAKGHTFIDRICFDYFFVWHIIEKEAIRLLLKELLTGS